MNNRNEEILNAWLNLSKSVNNERLVSGMTYNESLICNYLYRTLSHNPDQEVTATDLCQETKMLKSQMNRTLTDMEERKLILRKRSNIDKRRICIQLNPEQSRIYKAQHVEILRLIQSIVDELGEEKALQAKDLFNTIADIAGRILKK